MSSIKKFFKNFTIYTGTNFINQIIPFILLPILTRVLLPADYGILATFMAIMGITNVIISLGGSEAVVRGYFDKEKKGFDFSLYISNVIIIVFITFLILSVIIYCSKAFISQELSIPSDWLFLLPVIGFCSAISTTWFRLFIFKQKPLPYVASKFFGTSFELLLSIFFIVVLGLNWRGRVMGITISEVLLFVITIFFLFRNKLLRFHINYSYIKDILHYGIPVVFHSLGIVVIAATDRFFLNRLVGLSATGVYSVAYSISAVIGFLVGAFSLSWNPVLFEKLSKPSELLKTRLVKFTYLYFVFMILIALALVIAAPKLLSIFVGKNFYDASKFIGWIAFGYAFHGMYVILVGYIFYQKKTYLLSIVAGILIISNVSLNYVLIKLNGAIGAAQATFATFLFRFLLIWYLSNKVYPLPWFSFAKSRRIQ